MPATPAASRPHAEQPTLVRVPGDGIELAAAVWGGDGPPIVLAHATGFHARTWDAVVRRLPGRHVVALDLRGHGRSPAPAEPYTWDRFGADVAAALRGLGLTDVVGVGHSMGAHSMVDAARRDATPFAALLLIDPTISPPRPGGHRPPALAEAVGRRRNRWTSPEEFVERFRGRFPYSVWEPEVLEDHARFGLLPDPSGAGGLVLACPPAVEAEIYSHGATDLYGAIPHIDVPVRVLRARQAVPGTEAPPFFTSPTDPDLADAFPSGEDVLLGELSHFIPMEAPDVTARHIEEVRAGVA